MLSFTDDIMFHFGGGMFTPFTPLCLVQVQLKLSWCHLTDLLATSMLFFPSFSYAWNQHVPISAVVIYIQGPHCLVVCINQRNYGGFRTGMYTFSRNDI